MICVWSGYGGRMGYVMTLMRGRKLADKEKPRRLPGGV